MSLRNYFYKRLDDTQKGAYTELKSALLAHRKRITINYIPNIHRAISALKHDCAAELYFMNWIGIEKRISFNSAKCKIVLTPIYIFSVEEIAEFSKRIEKVVKSFAKYNEASVLCRKVHDWFSLNVQYDYDEINKHVYRRNNHNIIGPLIEKKAVCEGISLAYQYILSRFGIDCMTVSGRVLKTEGKYYNDYHAWNVISLNKNNYHVDVTWDHPININGRRYPTYGYYCMPTKFFKDHICGLSLKCESLEENLFYKGERLFSSAQQLRLFVSQRNPYDCCMIYVSSLLNDEIDGIIKKYGRYRYRIFRVTQFQQSNMIILMK